jgi:hypothetical protein
MNFLFISSSKNWTSWYYFRNGKIVISSKYCHVYHGWVVWLITLRGFGLVTGFVHYGDYNCTWLQLQWTLGTCSSLDPTDGTALRRRLTSRAEYFWLRRLTDDDYLKHWRILMKTDLFRFQRLTEDDSFWRLTGCHVTPEYHCWLRIHRDLLSLLGMTQPYPGYDCCLRSNTSQYSFADPGCAL